MCSSGNIQDLLIESRDQGRVVGGAKSGGSAGHSRLLGRVCPDPDCVKEGYCFPLKKLQPQSAYQRPLNIPMGSLKITQMFAFVPPPRSPPHLPLPIVLTYTLAGTRKKAKEGGGNRLIRIFRKQLESNTTLSCAQTQNGLCRGWPAIQRNNSVPATSIVNPNINNGGEWRVNAWRRILHKKL